MPGKVILAVTEGPIQGQQFSFEEHDTFIFGRALDCHARLSSNDKHASRHHFLLEVNPPEACLRDMGSRNGTYVNGRKYGGREKNETPQEAARRIYPEVNLKHGDQIRVGKSAFVVHIEAQVLCCECRIVIPEAFQRLCQWSEGSWICPACREKIEKSVKTGGAEKERESSAQKKQQTELTVIIDDSPSEVKPAPEAKPAPKMQLASELPKSAAEALKPIRCKECGKEMTGQAGGASSGEVLCEVCRHKTGNNPIDELLRMTAKVTQGKTVDLANSIFEYEIGQILGRGGMGAVYLARRKKDGLQVAIKVMLSRTYVEEHSRQIFNREIEVTKALQHPNIIRLLDHGSADRGFYFVMEYCPGGCLERRIQNAGGKLSLPEAKPIMLETLKGLSFAHERDIVHRDLKPQNILLSAERGGIAQVSDFGLAKNFQKAGYSGMTFTGAVLGTPMLMPREQLTNFRFSKPVSDVWSLGATFYYMLTGKFPREIPRGTDPIRMILENDPIPIREREASIPAKVGEVIDRALSDDIDKRFLNAGQFQKALERAW